MAAKQNAAEEAATKGAKLGPQEGKPSYSMSYGDRYNRNEQWYNAKSMHEVVAPASAISA